MVKTKKHNGHVKAPAESTWKSCNGDKVIVIESGNLNTNDTV